jgi:glycosyltransferase involved in cell wall biosynthesis
MTEFPGPPRGTTIRIGLISGYLGGGGGAERQITELATHLDRSRFEATVVALVPWNVRSKHGGTYYKRLADAGIEIVTIPRATRAGPFQLARLASWMHTARPHIVHSFLFSENWRTRLAALAAPRVCVFTGERSVNSWKRPHHHALERLLTRRAARVVVNAEAIRRFLVQKGGLPPEKVALIYNGVDTEKFAPRPDREAERASRGWPGEAFVVGHTGTMVAHKGQPQVLRACAAAAAATADLRVVLLGDGPDRGALVALARELGLEGRVVMPGFEADVPRVLGCLDAYLHFSREREGCSNAILEAMACGLPVVATDVGGNRELVEDGVTGFLVGEEDVAAAGAALRRLAVDRELRTRLGQAARSAAERQFGITRMVEATQSLYETGCP